MRFIRWLLYPLVILAVFFASTVVTITLLIKDTDSVICPDTIGKDLGEARRLAEQKGLSVVVVRYEKRKDIPYNEVIAQRPEASIAVRRGRTLSLVVSEGPLPVSIPDLLNQPLEMAQRVLQEKGIKVKGVLYVPGDEEGRVVGQSPRTGSQILEEDGMLLLVARKERNWYVMPTLSNTGYVGLVEELDRKGIEYRLNFIHIPDLPAKTVMETSVPPGSIFGSDQIVQITVNLGG